MWKLYDRDGLLTSEVALTDVLLLPPPVEMAVVVVVPEVASAFLVTSKLSGTVCSVDRMAVDMAISTAWRGVVEIRLVPWSDHRLQELGVPRLDDHITWNRMSCVDQCEHFQFQNLPKKICSRIIFPYWFQFYWNIGFGVIFLRQNFGIHTKYSSDLAVNSFPWIQLNEFYENPILHLKAWFQFLWDLYYFLE